MKQAIQTFFTALRRRISYRHGVPFMLAALLAVVIAAWPHLAGATSIWTIALLAFIATAVILLCGGRYRTFFITIAVMPPFLLALAWFLRLQAAFPDFPTRAVTEYFFYFVAAPILVVWMVATLLNRRQRHA